MREGGPSRSRSREADTGSDGSNVTTYVNYGREDQMKITGFTSSCLRSTVTWFLILLSCGSLRLVFHWRKHWMLWCTHRKTSNLRDAEKVLLVDHYNQRFVEDIRTITSDILSTLLDKNGNKRRKKAKQVKMSIIDIESYGALGSTPRHDHLLLPKEDGSFESVDSITFFDNKKVRYIWSPERKNFVKVPSLDSLELECSFFHRLEGLTPEEQDKRRFLYGPNEIEVKVQSILEILFNEVLGPFYVFQVFSIILWGFEEYLYYASCIIIMSSLGLISSVIQIRRNQTQLRDTVVGMDKVSVFRAGRGIYEDVDSTTLVPGDIISIPQHGCVMQCDAVLISGNAIVNESMLTGESVPVTKTPVPDIKHRSELYDSKEHAKHTLFCGTKVIQTRFYDGARVRAVVIRTGFQTAKGELVRSIMFPKPVDFKFNRHIYKFIRYLSILAAVGFIYTVILKAQRNVPLSDILLKALDLITIIIPPALPMAMTIGVIFAQTRLKSANIYCISPRSINISGCINCVCFDKTGTLTEDDLNFSEVVPVDHTACLFQSPIHDLKQVKPSSLIKCLATCHSLTIIDGGITGDPLDQKMFAATSWSLEEPAVDDTAKYDLLAPTVVKPFNSNPDGSDDVGILRQFPFSSSLQRMSVVTRTIQGTSFEVYAKGAPEVIVSLCIPSTVPTDFESTLQSYTQKGFRVLALAHRTFNISYAKVQRSTREDIEQELTFVGLLVMGNMLKPETTKIIDVLLAANIRPVMVTGDNMLTALSVARECHMIQPHHRVVLLQGHEEEGRELPRITWSFADQVRTRRDSIASTSLQIFRASSVDSYHHRNSVIKNGKKYDPNKMNDIMSFSPSKDDCGEGRLHVAVTGKTFRILRDYYPDLLKKVVIRGTVFARMAPDQKQQLVEILQELGYYVGMCGDGANDCGALKAAHAGVSLSETEASVASPFTSKTSNISCIPILIREGRASLVTAFGILKYMACYSICQFASVILLYTLRSNLTDFQFLYQDLFLISLFFVVFGRTESFPILAKNPPPSSLLGVTPLCSLGLQVILILGFQLLSVVLLWRQPFYQPANPLDPDYFVCHDNYAVFAVSVFQYITLAVVFSKGAPYRKAIYTNRAFCASLIIMTIFTVYVILYPIKWLSDLFEFDLSLIHMDFRVMMLMLAIINFILAFIAESFIVDYLIFIKLKEWLSRVTSSETPFETIFRQTRSTDWLPSPASSPILEDTPIDTKLPSPIFPEKKDIVNMVINKSTTNIAFTKTSGGENGFVHSHWS